jgi:hypothetical protein
MVHSWPVDRLAAPDYAGSPDGADFEGDLAITPTRMMNATQIFRKDVVVSDRERESNPAGIRDMYDHQVMKRFKEIARNFEYSVWRHAATGSATSIAGVGTTAAAPYMAGFGGFATVLATNCSGSSAMNLTDFYSLAGGMFNAGAEPDSVWMPPPAKLQFYNLVSGAGAINMRNIAATDMRLIANVDVFESPFGQLFAIITDRFMPWATASSLNRPTVWLGDRSLGKVAFFRPPQHKQMGKSGDNTRGIVLMEATLEVTHPTAWGGLGPMTGAAMPGWALFL